jgi:NADPH2:quinone reductase
MRAVLCTEWGGPEKLTVTDVPSPVPGPGQVRVRVRAAGVNFPDVLIIARKYQVRPELPFTPGAEVSGEVIEAGPGAAFAAGERVSCYCGTGGYAEEVVVEAARCVRLPDGIDFPVGAAFPMAYGTSWHALRDRAAMRAGETLLVLGAAGGVGLAAVDIGRAMGARVLAAASSPEKLAVARAHGAAEGIDTSRETLREAIARHTGGRGPDVIYDPVGGDLAEPAFRSIGWRGRYLVVGFAAGTIPALPLNLPLLKGAAIVGVFWGGLMKQEPEGFARETAELLEEIAAGRLRPLVSRSYKLADAPQALADMAARQVVGKVVLLP